MSSETDQTSGSNTNIVYRVWRFYVDGFKSMTIGKALWALILIKMAILFLVLKLFFFPDLLKVNYDNDADRAEAVRSALTIQKKTNN